MAARGERSERPVAGTDEAAQPGNAGKVSAAVRAPPGQAVAERYVPEGSDPVIAIWVQATVILVAAHEPASA
jgi:hypothetical protein